MSVCVCADITTLIVVRLRSCKTHPDLHTAVAVDVTDNHKSTMKVLTLYRNAAVAHTHTQDACETISPSV